MSQLGEKWAATQSSTSKKFRIDLNTQKLMIVRSGPADKVPDLQGAILTALTEKISMEIQGLGSSLLTQGQRIPLGPMAAYAQFGEGVIAQNTFNGYRYQYIPVVLASVGVELLAGDNAYALIESAIPDVSYEVFAIPTPTTGNLILNYVQQSVNAGDRHRKFDVDNVNHLVLPYAGLQKVVCTYKGGAVNEFSPLELLFLNAEGNDIETLCRVSDDQSNHADIVGGSMFSQAIVLLTTALAKVEIHTDGNLYEYVTVGEIDRNAR